jgi:hypothetical protein
MRAASLVDWLVILFVMKFANDETFRKAGDNVISSSAQNRHEERDYIGRHV